jgi:hypothetical protein
VVKSSDASLQPFGVAVAAADQAEALCGTHCGGEPTPGYLGHRCEQNRVLDAEKVGDSCV